MTKTAFSNRVELGFVCLANEPDTDMSFSSGVFTICVHNPNLFDTLEPGQTYQIELAIVVGDRKCQ